MHKEHSLCYTCLVHASRPARKQPVNLKLPRSQHRYNGTSTSSTTTSATRPANTFRPVLDIKHIARSPGLYSQNCQLRNYPHLAQHPFDILALTQRRAELVKESLDIRIKSRESSKKIERLRIAERDSKKKGMLDNKIMASLLANAQTTKKGLSSYTTELEDIELKLEQLAAGLPNLSSVWTPEGEQAKLIHTHVPSGITSLQQGKSHVDIGTRLKMLNFTSAALTSGWGWYFLTGAGALLEQALIQFALSTLHARGWTVVVPPSVVYAHVAAACGFQPRDQNGEQQIYALQQTAKDATLKPQHVLAGTAEIPLAGMHAGKTFEAKDLPLKAVAVSRCYRAEAGARGVDTKGLYRVHEFTKVEMFAWTPPDGTTDESLGSNFDTSPDVASSGQSHSTEMFNEMVNLQREMLEALQLPHRVLEMPTADLGASAARKIDIEAWFPGRTEASGEGWGEVTSTSICTDYQSRRLGTRVRRRDGEGLEWCHTVNGTAMAIPRVLAALLENGWNDDTKTLTIPQVLRPWMYGMDVLQASE